MIYCIEIRWNVGNKKCRVVLGIKVILLVLVMLIWVLVLLLWMRVGIGRRKKDIVVGVTGKPRTWLFFISLVISVFLANI